MDLGIGSAVEILSRQDSDDRDLQDVIENGLLAVRRWMEKHPRTVPTREISAFLMVAETHYGRRQRDLRQERRLRMGERALIKKLGGAVSESELDAEVDKMVERRIRQLSPAKIDAIANARRAELESALVDPGDGEPS